MTNLFQNAINSIQLGVEDYKMNTPKRSISAVRNFYSGTLLLAKEVLCRTVPNAKTDLVLAAKYSLRMDGNGGVEIVPQGYKTIDFEEIGKRFKSFGIPVDDKEMKILQGLQRVRNEIKHKYSELPHDSVNETIANVFPLVLKLLEWCGEDPRDALGDAYPEMILIEEAYEREFAKCRSSFQNITFPFDELREHPFSCSKCDSELVAQTNATNTDHQSMRCKCKSCGEEMEAELAIESALSKKYWYDSYEAAKQGLESVIEQCHECSLETYLLGKGCVWCETKLGKCRLCECELNPNTLSPDFTSTCGYCAHRISKAD